MIAQSDCLCIVVIEVSYKSPSSDAAANSTLSFTHTGSRSRATSPHSSRSLSAFSASKHNAVRDVRPPATLALKLTREAKVAVSGTEVSRLAKLSLGAGIALLLAAVGGGSWLLGLWAVFLLAGAYAAN